MLALSRVKNAIKIIKLRKKGFETHFNSAQIALLKLREFI